MCDPKFAGADCKTCKTPFYSNNKTGGCDFVYNKLIKCFLTFSFIEEYKNYYPSDTKNYTNIYTYYYFDEEASDLKIFLVKPNVMGKYDFSWQKGVNILIDYSNSPQKHSQLNSSSTIINVKYKLSQQARIIFDIYYNGKVIGTATLSLP